jgi:4-cresol dehydrogenase (hydroxylating) flavoprotein subunit
VEVHMGQAMPAFRDACTAIKAALDPKGVIAPGRYGIS